MFNYVYIHIYQVHCLNRTKIICMKANSYNILKWPKTIISHV